MGVERCHNFWTIKSLLKKKKGILREREVSFDFEVQKGRLDSILEKLGKDKKQFPHLGIMLLAIKGHHLESVLIAQNLAYFHKYLLKIKPTQSKILVVI